LILSQMKCLRQKKKRSKLRKLINKTHKSTSRKCWCNKSTHRKSKTSLRKLKGKIFARLNNSTRTATSKVRRSHSQTSCSAKCTNKTNSFYHKQLSASPISTFSKAEKTCGPSTKTSETTSLISADWCSNNQIFCKDSSSLWMSCQDTHV
jgi:hypothetical protein